jgi:protein-S-isoprenylcysteine O-methyltransferase Ste14
MRSHLPCALAHSTDLIMKTPVPVTPHPAGSPDPAAFRAHPDLLVFPPVLPLGSVALGVLLEWLFPLSPVISRFPGVLFRVSGVILLLAGLVIMISARRALVRAGTNVDPRRPVLYLVESWPFNWTRNPIYLGGNLGALGLGLLFRLHWMLLIYPIAMVICHYGIVLREETYLAQRFGVEYANYKARVRRWL